MNGQAQAHNQTERPVAESGAGPIALEGGALRSCYDKWWDSHPACKVAQEVKVGRTVKIVLVEECKGGRQP